MSESSKFTDKLQSIGTQIGQRIQDSPTYSQLKDRYENLSPSGQKLTNVLVVVLILFLLLFIPFTNISESSSTLSNFEDKRNLIRDLFKTYRETSGSSKIPVPPTQEALRSSIESIISRAELIPEQILGTIEIAPEGRLIPANLSAGVLQVQLAKLNIRQIVDIGAGIIGISESVKMKDIQIVANRQDTRYYDVTYKLYSLKVPTHQIEFAPESEKPVKKSRGSNE